jgi:hypothetical protein
VQTLLTAGHYVDAARARDALRRRLQFNVIDARSAFKIDLIMRKERALADAAGVLAVNPGSDRAYVERWASELGVLDLWQEISGPSRG